MKILVLNCGSSSVKYKLFDIDSKSVLAQGGAEKIGLEDSFLKLTLPNGEKVILKTSMPEHHSAIQNILNVLTGKEYGSSRSMKSMLLAIGSCTVEKNSTKACSSQTKLSKK